jgi:hypothetical protein
VIERSLRLRLRLFLAELARADAVAELPDRLNDGSANAALDRFLEKYALIEQRQQRSPELAAYRRAYRKVIRSHEEPDENHDALGESFTHFTRYQELFGSDGTLWNEKRHGTTRSAKKKNELRSVVGCWVCVSDAIVRAPMYEPSDVYIEIDAEAVLAHVLSISHLARAEGLVEQAKCDLRT